MMEQAVNSNSETTENLSDAELVSALEALLFASGEPMEIEQMVKLIGIEKEKVSAGLQRIQEKLSSDPESGLRLLFASSGVQMVTAEKHSVLIESFLQYGTREQLAPAAAEVLAIVAYRGPIHRAGIEAIRGVNSTFSLRQLSVRGLIERYPSEKDSRVFLYRISAEFLRHLGIERIEDLPDFEKFRQHEGMTNLEKSVSFNAEKKDSEKEIDNK